MNASGRAVLEENGSIPEAWELGVLADFVGRPEYGYTDSASDDSTGTRFLRITDIQNGQVDWSSVPYCNCSRDIIDSKGLHPGDIVVARIGATTGKSFYIDSTPDEAVFASYLIRLRAKSAKLLPRFLFFYMQTADYWTHVDRHKGDRLRGGVNIPVLESLPVVVPPVDEQIRIASVLDSVQTACRSEATQGTLAADLKKALLSEIFTRGLRGEPQKETEVGLLPERWKVEPLAAHHSVVSGGTPSRSNPKYWEGGTIPWVKTTEVNYSLIRETQEHLTDEGLKGSAARLLPAGTILLAMYGQGITRGKVAILGIEAACNQACAAIRPTDAVVIPLYLYHFLAHRYEDIRRLAHGGQQQNLNLEIVRSFPIAYPVDRDEQREIVAILDAIDRKIELHRRKRAVLDDLFKALLRKLMTGEIRVADLDLSALTAEPTSEVAA